MRISSFEVEGFGALSELRLEGLSPGLVVVSGPNEAGKSTLMDFLSGVLFGFPSRRADPRHRAPVGTARHGGRVVLAEGAETDHTWTVERFAAPKKLLQIRRPGGLEASEDDLRRALGGADEALFRAVFAVDLTELGSADALGRDSVRELLFSASILGQRRSASRAMEHLQKQRAELARPRQGEARVNRLLAERAELRRQLADATRDTAAYPDRELELRRIEAEVDAARRSEAEARRRLRELELLDRLWHVLEQRRGLEQMVAGFEQPAPLVTWLEQNAATIRALQARCSGHLERVARLEELRQQRSAIDESVERSLGALGPSWDRPAIRASGDWIALADEVRAARDVLAERETRCQTASARVDEAASAPELATESSAAGAAGVDGAARGAVGGLSGSKPAAGDGDIASGTPAGTEAIGARLQLLAELRRNLAEQRELAAERRVADHERQQRGGGTAPGTRLSLLALVLLLVGLVVLAASSHENRRVLAGCALLATVAIVGLVALLSGSRATKARATADLDGEADAALARVSARVGELARTLHLPLEPSASDVESAAQLLADQRERQRSLEDRERRREEASGRLRAAVTIQVEASEALERERARFAEWKSAHRFARELGPDAVLESLATLKEAWEKLQALQRVDATIADRRREVASFEATMDELEAGLPPSEAAGAFVRADPGGTLETLCRRLDDELRVRSEHLATVRQLADATVEIDRSLGTGPDADRLSAELESGEVLVWQDEHAALERERAESVERVELLVRTHQDATRELRALASSARVAELTQQQLALEAELDETLRSWMLASCARLLLERTLRRHEQERQPAVLARAGELFSKVTHGRYTRLLPSVDDEGPRQAIRVISRTGAELDAASLSRGTIEQLYLCLRLGLAETFAARAVPLPLLLDDVLVNFDPERAAAVVEALADTAAAHQVIVFTCHPHLVELVHQVEPHAQVVELGRL